MTDMASRATKSESINLRATQRQKALLRRAAEATDHSLTEFILGSAVDHAEQVLADRRWFAASDEQFEEFVRLLDEPLPKTEKFDRLFSRPSRFASDAT
ncbi:MAG: DUF1778 domain-containing protein [Propionibacteriaceae bacterium]|nr:DUF1778 domain-containing protein [Propionibacteriaceae bacterium]